MAVHWFGWGFSLTGCPQPRVKLPWTAILGMPRHGRRCMPTRPAPTPFPACLGKSPSKPPHRHRAIPPPSDASPFSKPPLNVQNPNRKLKINHQNKRINYRSNKRTGHNRRVKPRLLCQHGKRTSHHLRNQHCHYQRNTDNRRN